MNTTPTITTPTITTPNSTASSTTSSTEHTTVLHLSSSTSGAGSVTELLASELIDRLLDGTSLDDVTVVRRELRHLPLLTEASTTERGVAVDERTEAGQRDLAIADELIEELLAADVLVIGAPIYNFGPPASLKAWADLVARPGTTFAYSKAGPQGLVSDRPVYVVAASGGTPVGGDTDFGTTWLRRYLGFLGLTDVRVIGAQGVAINPDAGLALARTEIADVQPIAALA